MVADAQIQIQKQSIEPDVGFRRRGTSDFQKERDVNGQLLSRWAAERLTICNMLDPLFCGNPHILIHGPRQNGERNQIRTSGYVVLRLAGRNVEYGLVVKKFDS